MKRALLLLFLLFSAAAWGTVTTPTYSVAYTCTGGYGPFQFAFPISEPAALMVNMNGTILGSTAYTVTPVNNDYSNGGSVTLNVSNPCTAGWVQILTRNTPITQTIHFYDNMPIPMKTFERGLDKLTEIDQEIWGGSVHNIHINNNGSPVIPNTAGGDLTFNFNGCPVTGTQSGQTPQLSTVIDIACSGGGGGGGGGSCPVINWMHNGTIVGAEYAANLLDTTGHTFSLTDNPTNNRMDISVTTPAVGDTITSPNNTLGVGGTPTNTTLDVLGAAGKMLAGATPALTYTPTLGVPNSTAGTLGLASAAANATTTLESGATTNWTLKFPATGGTNGYVLETDGSGVTSWVSPPSTGDTITSPNSTITVGGTVTNTTVDVVGAAGKIMAGAIPALTYTPDLGVDNTSAGTLTLANGSASAHTVFGSAATTSNTILGPVTVPTTGHILGCTTSSTTCTLTDMGTFPPFNAQINLGVPYGAQDVTDYVLPTTTLGITIPANCSTSTFYGGGAASTGSPTFKVYKNTTLICTGTVTTGSPNTIAWSTGGTSTSFAAADLLRVVYDGDLTFTGAVTIVGSQP